MRNSWRHFRTIFCDTDNNLMLKYLFKDYHHSLLQNNGNTLAPRLKVAPNHGKHNQSVKTYPSLNGEGINEHTVDGAWRISSLNDHHVGSLEQLLLCLNALHTKRKKYQFLVEITISGTVWSFRVLPFFKWRLKVAPSMAAIYYIVF